ncbi:MAG: hypothetical protein PHP13_02005 [Methanomicrobium sp.]|nr:hypothetical protein [Methanomicrobium sp.]MDD4299721.1 hypothetical protein [Methanomicrobium sp.]
MAEYIKDDSFKDASENMNAAFKKEELQINYPGLAAGILMLILPFAGKWWTLQFGEDALFLAVSPFSLSVFSFGKEIVSPLFSSLTAALTVVTILFGIFMIAGSVPAINGGKKEISQGLINSGSLKMLFVAALFIFAVIFAGISFQQYFQEFGFSGNFPLLAGHSEMILISGDITVAIPVKSSILPAFYAGLIAAALGAASRFYGRKKSAK